ncbi:hypothetical protein [Sphingobium nicotianae]|uniref:DUF8021 domain-containing protein n=1 Tax=Sphingobium nicotianae TaxID=2782607 RepID=A0A9X1DF60_9SPHN|nr:hypothetical protein [Sphingobium nicotianae]MBT2189107.1 hypothetical protein [Sphingobium nicotianae]
MRTTLALLALGATALALPAAASAAPCDEACLLKLADQTMVALARQDWKSLPWADPVGYSENGVRLMIGDAGWGSAGATVGKKAFAAADARTGNVVWIGTMYDHDAPAFGGVRIKAPEGKIQEIELIVARKGLPMLFGDPLAFTIDKSFAKPLAAADKRSRERLIDVANAYLGTKQRNNGTLLTQFTPGCEFKENGLSLTAGTTGPGALAKGCEAQLQLGAYQPIDRIRDRRFPVVDEATGLVVAISLQDMPQREASFTTTDGRKVSTLDTTPMSQIHLELIRVEGDKVARSEGVTVAQPLNMPSPWKE